VVRANPYPQGVGRGLLVEKKPMKDTLKEGRKKDRFRRGSGKRKSIARVVERVRTYVVRERKEGD